MNMRHALRRPSRPARSDTIKRSATMSTVSREDRATTQSSTSTATSYLCAASNKAMVSLSLLSSEVNAPVYMKRIMRCTAFGSRSVMVTSFSACSFIEVDHIASKTGDLAARTTLCARICSSPTFTTTSVSRPESSKAPNCAPKSANASGFVPIRYGTDSILEKDTVILHSTVRVSSTNQPFVGSNTAFSGINPSACSRPMA
mmetsp:Transcript_19765/g.62654  ORF Transcript_19765/g.62654 Transcript_19765/m.62654 type:complete len:202 (+) Transcript_19765:337-942(+)